MGSSQSSEKKTSPSKEKESPSKPETPTKPTEDVTPTLPTEDLTPTKPTESPCTSAGDSVQPSEPTIPTQTKGEGMCTRPRIISVSPEEIARIEAATKDKQEKEGGLKYDVVLSPAVKKAPKISPPSSPLTEEDIQRKLREAESRRLSLDNIRMRNLSAQLAKVELVQQKKEDIMAEKSSKAAEVLSSKLTVAEEKRTAQLQVVKDKLGEHMSKIEKAQKELELQLEAARVATEASLREKMEKNQKNRDEEMEEMLKKIQDHQEKISKVRTNQEEKLRPYVAELENSIKEKLERARQAKEKQEEQLLQKLAEQSRKAEIVRQNRERILAEGGLDCSLTNESASSA